MLKLETVKKEVNCIYAVLHFGHSLSDSRMVSFCMAWSVWGREAALKNKLEGANTKASMMRDEYT